MFPLAHRDSCPESGGSGQDPSGVGEGAAGSPEDQHHAGDPGHGDTKD